MEHILRCHLLKFMKPEAVHDYDEDNIVKKTGKDLINVDVHNEKLLLSRRLVFIGQKANELIKKLKLNPISCHLDDFYDFL